MPCLPVACTVPSSDALCRQHLHNSRLGSSCNQGSILYQKRGTYVAPAQEVHLSQGKPMASVAAASTTGSRSTAWTSMPGKWCARKSGRLPPPVPMHSAQGRNSVLSAAVRHRRRSGLFWLCPITAAAAGPHTCIAYKSSAAWLGTCTAPEENTHSLHNAAPHARGSPYGCLAC